MTIQKTIALALQRSTPGTYVYQEGEQQTARQTFPTIYVKKHAFNGSPAPQVLYVTISDTAPTK